MTILSKIKINWNYALLLIVVLSLYPALRNIGSMIPGFNKPQVTEVTLPESLMKPEEVVFDDNSVMTVTQQSLTSDEIPKEQNRKLDDGSQIVTSFDAFGNKTEIRQFYNNPKLKQILIRTSADGQKQVYVYGQNGEVETLPDSMLATALQAPASEIATRAGITNTKQPKTRMISTLYVPLPQVEQNTAEQQIVQQNPLPTPNAARENTQEETKPQIEAPVRTDAAATTATPALNLDTRKSMTDSLSKP